MQDADRSQIIFVLRRILIIAVLCIVFPAYVVAATNGVSANYSNGAIKIGTNTGVCTSVTLGAIRYSSATNALETCNGTNWGSTVLGFDSVVASCVSANRGALRYLSTGILSTTVSAVPVVASTSDFHGGPGVISLPLPSGTVAGDLLVMIGGMDFSGWSIPGDFTLIAPYSIYTNGGDGQEGFIAYKIAGAAEPASYTLGGSGYGSIALLRITGANAASPIDTYSTFATGSTTLVPPAMTVSASTITTTSNNDLLIWAVAPDTSNNGGDSAFSIPSGYTDVIGALETQWSSLEVATKSQAIAGATGAISGTLSYTGATSGSPPYAMGYISYAIAIKSGPSTVYSPTGTAQVCDGSNWLYIGSPGIAAGSNGNVQYNNSGVIAGSNSLTYTNSSGILNSSGPYTIGGANALSLTTSGNPVIGTSMSTTLAPLSSGIGIDTLKGATAEVNSLAIGEFALQYTSTSTNNTAIGGYSMYAHSSGNNITAIGAYSYNWSGKGGDESTALGPSAMSGGYSLIPNVGSNNTALGSSALWVVSTGQDNTTAGRRALYSVTTGGYNTTAGSSALSAAASYYTGAGDNAFNNGTGAYNTGFGLSSIGGSTLTSGTNNILIGGNSDTTAATSTYQVNIGKLIYGNISTGAVGIGTSSFTGPFMVAPPATQGLGLSGTIAATACGSMKTISSSLNLSLSPTNVFTAPSTSNAGCCMDVVNTGSRNLTLPSQPLFKTVGGASVVLGAGGSVRVCSTGAAWYQVSGTSAAH